MMEAHWEPIEQGRGIEFVYPEDQLDLKDMVRLIEIAHVTSDGGVRAAALQILKRGLFPPMVRVGEAA